MIDLHAHTKASDGEKTSEELIDLAISKNLDAIAITDHDTIDGLESAEKYVKNKDILFVPGIELEAKTKTGQMHILGLFINYNNPKFLKKLLNIKQSRISRNEKFIEYFQKIGFEISIEELKEISGGKTIGKPHFARLFLKKNYIKTKDEMFDKYFNQPPLNSLEKSIYSPKEIIEMIKDANGIVVLAHPQTLKLNDEDLIKKIKELKFYGLDGLECYHSKQTHEEMIKFNKIAQKFNLIITKGSDFHGLTVKPGIELGTGKNNNIISDEENNILKSIIKLVNTRKN